METRFSLIGGEVREGKEQQEEDFSRKRVDMCVQLISLGRIPKLLVIIRKKICHIISCTSEVVVHISPSADNLTFHVLSGISAFCNNVLIFSVLILNSNCHY